MPDGTIITFDGDGADFVHPFQVSLVGTEAASIRPGTVNRVDAKIKDVPLAGTDDQPPPLLKFGQPMLDDEGRGYICVEVTCREKDWSVEKVEVVQVADPNTDDGEAGEGTAATAVGRVAGPACALPAGDAARAQGQEARPLPDHVLRPATPPGTRHRPQDGHAAFLLAMIARRCLEQTRRAGEASAPAAGRSCRHEGAASRRDRVRRRATRCGGIRGSSTRATSSRTTAPASGARSSGPAL